MPCGERCEDGFDLRPLLLVGHKNRALGHGSQISLAINLDVFTAIIFLRLMNTSEVQVLNPLVYYRS